MATGGSDVCFRGSSRHEPDGCSGAPFVAANSDSSADPLPNLTCLVPLIGFASGVLRENAQVVRPEGDARAADHTGRTSNEIQTSLDDAGRRRAPGRELG